MKRSFLLAALLLCGCAARQPRETHPVWKESGANDTNSPEAHWACTENGRIYTRDRTNPNVVPHCRK